MGLSTATVMSEVGGGAGAGAGGSSNSGRPATSSTGAGSCSVPPEVSTVLHDKLDGMDFAFVVSDCMQTDMPIVYASPRFLEMTGYDEQEVVGRNCRFLNGPQTERRKLMEIRDGIREERPCQVCLLNFKKDGMPFWNQLHLSPLRAADGRVTHYIGVQADVTHIVVPSHAAHTKSAGAEAPPAELGSTHDDLTAAEQLEKERRRLEGALQLAPGGSPRPGVVEGEEWPGAGNDAGSDGRDVLAGQSDESEEGVEDVEGEELREAAQVAQALQEAGALPRAPSSSVLPSSLLSALLKIREAFILSDPRRPDCPIVHASDAFLRLTGYDRDEVIGRNFWFLHGPANEGPELDRLRAALTDNPPQPVTATLVQYRKGDQDPWWSSLHVAPIRDADGAIEYLVAVHTDLTAEGTRPHQAASSPAPPVGALAAAAADAAATAMHGRQQACPGPGGGEGPAEGLPPGPAPFTLAHRLAHSSTVAAVRVAARALTGQFGGLRRLAECQMLPRRGSCGGGGGSSSAAAREKGGPDNP